MKVIDETAGKDYSFPCSRWLARDEEDGQIMRELLCSNALTPRDDKEKVSKYTPIYEVDQSNFKLVEHGDWDTLLCYG